MARHSKRRTRPSAILVSTLAAAMAGCGTPTTQRSPATPPAAELAIPRLVTYQPFAATYRASTRRLVEQEFNGQRTTTRVAMDYYLSTELEQTTDGLRATLRVDSVPRMTGLPQREAALLTGAIFTAFLSRTGQLHDFEGSAGHADLVRQVSLRLQEFFPQLPAEGARPGQDWTDTAETNAGTQDLELLIHSVNHHQVLGWDRWAGEPGLHIRTVSDYTLTGAGFESGQEYTLRGNGVEHADRYISRDGRFLGEVSVDTLHSTAVIDAIAATIPITQTRTDTLTIIP